MALLKILGNVKELGLEVAFYFANVHLIVRILWHAIGFLARSIVFYQYAETILLVVGGQVDWFYKSTIGQTQQIATTIGGHITTINH